MRCCAKLHMLERLPPELIRSCLAALTSYADMLTTAQVCSALNLEADSSGVWRALYDAKWPPWTLLVPEDGVDLPVKELFRLRLRNEVRLQISPSVHVLRGSTTDHYDSNVTPLECALCNAPPGRLSTALEMSGKLLAQVHFGAGSLHNEPALRCWLGQAVPGTPVHVEWREHSSTFGHWVYEGTVSKDGREICGVFHYSILPRKRGSFGLRACDPATYVGGEAGGLPSAFQLAKRVAVKWCSSALAKLAAREELSGGAA